MEPWHLAHLILLAIWGGLVLCEIVIEMSGSDDAARRARATLHFWIDMLVEVPLLVGVLATGALLAWRAWPLSPLHVVKVVAALAAIAANFVCVGIVVRRHRRGGDALALRRMHRGVVASAAVGVPFAAVAAIIGFSYFNR